MSEAKKNFNRIATCSAVIIIALFLTGMGTLGEKETSKIPEPEYNFSAIIIDQFDVSSVVNFFSIDGLTFISGKRGNATISVPFDNIKSTKFYKKDSKLSAIVIMRDGAEIELKIDKEHVLYGRLPYGILSIDIIDVKKIIINGLAQQGK